MPRYNYTNEEIINAVKNSKSIAQVCRCIGLVPVGGNYQTIGRLINKLKLNVNHFTGSGWNVGNYKPVSECKSRNTLKSGLIRKRGHICERCNRKTWLRKLIPLELEHMNGDRSNNNETNLKLLCPNCHSFTPTYRRTKASLVPEGRLELPLDGS